MFRGNVTRTNETETYCHNMLFKRCTHCSLLLNSKNNVSAGPHPLDDDVTDVNIEGQGAPSLLHLEMVGKRT